MRSIGHPELATLSERVDTTDIKREREPSSLVSPVADSPLRQSVEPFQKRRVTRRFVPLSPNSTEKCWVAATCSAMSYFAQLKRCGTMELQLMIINLCTYMYMYVYAQVEWKLKLTKLPTVNRFSLQSTLRYICPKSGLHHPV